jgi:hypothetical protein
LTPAESEIPIIEAPVELNICRKFEMKFKYSHTVTKCLSWINRITGGILTVLRRLKSCLMKNIFLNSFEMNNDIPLLRSGWLNEYQ